MVERGAQLIRNTPSTAGSDTLTSTNTNVTEILAAQSRMRQSMVFWSDVQVTVTITTTASDISLPSVVVTGLPDGITIKRVIALFKFRSVSDTSGSANELETGGTLTPAIQVRDDTPGTYVDAINLADAQFVVGGSETAPGDFLVGDNDIKTTVDENDTYNFQIDDGDAVGNNLILRDVYCGLKIEYAVVEG